MASAAARRAGRAPDVNCFDLVELMPGAQPSANPAQRYEFEERCKALRRREAREEAARRGAAWAAPAPAEEASLAASLEAMFPAIEPELIRTLLEELPSEQMALETLLALSSAFCEEDREAPSAAPGPGAEDHGAFPTLLDAGGWQVAGSRQLDSGAGEEEDLGSAWRDRALAAAMAPVPRGPKLTYAPTAAPRPCRPGGPQEGGEGEEDEDDGLTPTDYELRHGLGRQRARQRSQHKQRRGSLRPAGPSGANAGALACGPAARGPAIRGSHCEVSDLESMTSEPPSLIC